MAKCWREQPFPLQIFRCFSACSSHIQSIYLNHIRTKASTPFNLPFLLSLCETHVGAQRYTIVSQNDVLTGVKRNFLAFLAVYTSSIFTWKFKLFAPCKLCLTIHLCIKKKECLNTFQSPPQPSFVQIPCKNWKFFCKLFLIFWLLHNIFRLVILISLVFIFDNVKQ